MKNIDLIIPTYNVSKYLPALFKSLDGQILGNEYYNVIFVDDGSTDNTYELVGEYAENKPNVSFYKKKNEGVGLARQYGFDKGSSKYVIYMDPDDFIHKKYMSTWNKYANQGYDLIYSNWFMSSKRTGFGNKFPLDDKIKYFFIILRDFFKSRPRFVGTQNKMWKRSAVKSVKWQSFKKAQDVAYFADAIKKVNTIKEIGKGTSYYYRDMRAGSANEKSKVDKSYNKAQRDAIKYTVESLESFDSKNPKVNKIIKNELKYRKNQL